MLAQSFGRARLRAPRRTTGGITERHRGGPRGPLFVHSSHGHRLKVRVPWARPWGGQTACDSQVSPHGARAWRASRSPPWKLCRPKRVPWKTFAGNAVNGFGKRPRSRSMRRSSAAGPRAGDRSRPAAGGGPVRHSSSRSDGREPYGSCHWGACCSDVVSQVHKVKAARPPGRESRHGDGRQELPGGCRLWRRGRTAHGR